MVPLGYKPFDSHIKVRIAEYNKVCSELVAINPKADWKVPRSSKNLHEDNEYALYTVTLLKRDADNFRTKARKRGFQIRDIEYNSETQESQKQELKNLMQDQESTRSSLLQWCYTSYGERVFYLDKKANETRNYKAKESKEAARTISIQLPSRQLLPLLFSRQVLPRGINASDIRHKFHADGTLSRYEARLVANGSSQQLGVDFDETFSPVVKPGTIRTVLSLDVSRQWPIYQLDVKNAFFNGDLSENVYIHQPPGFVDSRYAHHVCLLQRSLYGLKQAPRAWFQRFADLLQQLIASLHNEFDMTDLEALNYFLGIFADRTSTGLFLSQKKYALQLLERAHMVNCNPSRTPVDTESKLGPEGVPVQDPTLYRSLAGGLQAALCCRQTYLAICLGDYGFWSPFVRFRYSFSAKRQHTLSCSIAEAEYRGVANVFAETA
nr:ribonuclease H-like domain-containing protein [Tanacetum cinerariifolium]